MFIYFVLFFELDFILKALFLKFGHLSFFMKIYFPATFISDVKYY